MLFFIYQLIEQAKTLEPAGQLAYNALFDGKRKQAIVKAQINQVQAEIALIDQKIVNWNNKKACFNNSSSN
ncbi:hypothetical protein [Arsenophonus endosymbiont of Aleurodicus floccissimus]|uniref:hypothetical protein n=1 Tax=Arsenophonus endosymbiont of Aleurodicus floccissimus TaxID=2152761 RepID=UPI003F6EADB1